MRASPRKKSKQRVGHKAAARRLSRSLPMALMRAREAVMQQFRPHLRAIRVTEQQWRVLRLLHSGGATDASTLARQSFLLPPSLTRILRDLQRQGWVARRRAQDDARRQIIVLTPKGEALLARGAVGTESRYKLIAARLGEDKLRQLFRLLDELDAALAEPQDD